MTDLFASIQDAVRTASGITVNASLTPLSGSRHVLPPTYADAPHKHNMTEPDGSGISAWVSIDSAASFANRVEHQLVRTGLNLAPLRAEASDKNWALSTLEMPHRAYDAILRDCSLNGTVFRKTDIGQAVLKASPKDACALLRYDPAVLLLGGWDSTGLGTYSGQERKWPAALSVEITGANARLINRAGGRLDPLGITLDAGRVIREDDSYRLIPEGEDVPKDAVRPSEINHGNIAPTVSPKGVLVESIHLTGALSLSRLRRYNFGDKDANLNARTFLACMGIYGVAAELEDGLDLRRDCELVADQITWTIRATDRSDALKVDAATALAALKKAMTTVPLADPVIFIATDNLEQLIARSH